MRSVTVRLDDLRTTILCLGYVGENEHTRINIDAKKMYDQYPSASASLTVCPPEGESYPAVITRDGDMVIWDITDSDLVAEGSGEIQLSFTQGETVAKTFIGRFKVSRSLVPTGDIPSGLDDFLTRAGAALTAIPETIDEALDEAKASGEFDGADGQDGQDGADGFSPIATVTKSGNKATISITDANGTTTAEVTDGADGAPGQDGAPGIDGFSPRATVSKSGSTATITITDAAGTTTAQISDGESADIIDDTAGAGDTDKVWSADKSAAENSSLLTEINSKADKTVTDALQIGKAPVIIDSAEGNPIVLTDGADGLPVESMKIHFLPTQSGTGDPSPSNVRPISGWTGVTAWRTGRNLLDPGEATSGKGLTLTKNADGSIDVSGTPTGSWIDFGWHDVSILAGSYMLGLRASIPCYFVLYYYLVGDSERKYHALETGQTSKAITFAGEVERVCFGLTTMNTSTEYDFNLAVQLELGSTASPYTPYTGQSYPITFPDGQTIYGGTVYPLDGRMLVEWAKILLNGSETGWNKYNQDTSFSVPIVGMKSGAIKQVLCDRFKQINNISNYGVYANAKNNYAYFIRAIDIEGVTDLVTWKAYLAQNPMEFAFELATPYEIQLDPIVIQTLLGDNTIWSDANGTIELDYRADTKLFISKQKTDIRATIAPIEDGATASQAYSAGKFFYRGGQFCKAKTSIASGATFTLNTNYQITTVADELFALN